MLNLRQHCARKLQVENPMLESHVKILSVGVCLSAIALLSSLPVLAQESGGATSVLIEEVLVTARKRSDLEKVQDVPVSVTAFSGDQIEALFANDLTDITAHVPNAQAYTSGTFPGYVNFFIRGMGVAGTVLSDDPAVGVFVDGVYQGVSAGIVFDTFDLDGVEILRGPQGTLFGRNVTAGAALLRTRKPTEEFNARVRVTGGNDGQLNVAGSISGPIVADKLLGKLAVFHTQLDDWMDNPSGNAVGADDLGEQDQQVVRGALTWLASDTLTVDFRFERGEAENDPYPIFAIDNTLLLGVQPIPGLSESGARDSDDPISIGAITAPSDAEWSSASVEVNWDLAQGSLRSITGWRDYEQEDLAQDFDGSVVAIFDVNNSFIEQDQISQEFIYNVDLTDTIALSTGAFYFSQEYEYGERRFGALFAAAGGGLQSHAESEHEVRGVYVQTDIDLSEAWTLTLGLRQSWEDKDVSIGQFGSSLSCTDVQDLDPRTCEYNFFDDEDWSNLTYRAGIQFTPNNDTQFYGSYSRGFRSGGFNIRQNVGVVPGPYDEEIVDAFEVGVKADLADGRIRVNAAYFLNEYDDLQRTVVGADGFQTVSNAAEASISGFEVEAFWMITDGLLLQGSMGYTDAEIQNFVNPRGGVGGAPLVVDGTSMPFVPEWQRNLNLIWDVPMGEGALTLRAGYQFVDEVESTDDNLGFKGSPYEVYDASVAYGPNSGLWRVTLFGKNLTDNIESGLITNAANPGWILGQARNPMRYGLELMVEFD